MNSLLATKNSNNNCQFTVAYQLQMCKGGDVLKISDILIIRLVYLIRTPLLFLSIIAFNWWNKINHKYKSPSSKLQFQTCCERISIKLKFSRLMDKLHPYCLIRDDLRISAEGIQCNIVILKTDMFEKKMKRKHDSFQLLQRSFKNRFFN